jgi:hypothetical protein
MFLQMHLYSDQYYERHMRLLCRPRVGRSLSGEIGYALTFAGVKEATIPLQNTSERCCCYTQSPVLLHIALDPAFAYVEDLESVRHTACALAAQFTLLGESSARLQIELDCI